MFTPQVHFKDVGLTAFAASVAAFALTIAGAKRRDARTILVGTAFTVMAALLALHGIATPGILVEMSGVVAFTGGATLPVGAAVLALSALPALRRPRGVKPLLLLQAVLVPSVVTLGVVGMLVPSAVPAVPTPGSTSALTVLVIGLALCGLLTLRAVRTFLLTRRRSDLGVAVGLVWLATALPPAMLLNGMELGWWIGHWLELLGIVVVFIPVALDLQRTAQSRPLVGDVSGADLVTTEEAFLGAQVRALTLSLAKKDEYTEEHTRREWGEKMLVDLGFDESVRQLVRDHHERLDGSGYPHGANGSLISFDARILGVCDVYDALISRRVYRNAGRTSAPLHSCGRKAVPPSTRSASRRSSACSRSSAPPPRPRSNCLPADLAVGFSAVS
ncbi:MAG TPA: HD domain-containing phosphohydrolase [Gaiellaceae bacterium]